MGWRRESPRSGRDFWRSADILVGSVGRCGMQEAGKNDWKEEPTESWRDRIMNSNGAEPNRRMPSGARDLEFIGEFDR